MSRVGGIVLCGGRSSRMGRSKAWLPIGSEPMLARVVRTVRAAVEPVVVVAGPGQDVPKLPTEVRVVHDHEEGLGPLAGLAVGLEALQGQVEAAYLSACDVPFLRVEFLRRIVEGLIQNREDQQPLPNGRGSDHEHGPGALELAACVPDVGGHLHPLAAAYRVSVLPAARTLIAAGRLRPVFLFDMVLTRYVGPDWLREADPDLRSLRNLNTQEEYDNARTELEAPGAGSGADRLG